MGGVLVDALVGLAAYAAARKGGDLLSQYLPASIPQAPLVAEVGAAALVGFLGSMLVKDPKKKEAILVASVIAGALAVIPSSIAQSLSLEKVVMLPPPAPASGVGAALEAQLATEEEEVAY